MKNKYASTTSLKLVPDYDELSEQGLIPEEPSIQVVYCFKKCRIEAGVCTCTINMQTSLKFVKQDRVKIEGKKSQKLVEIDEQESKKEEDEIETGLKGVADDKIKGVLKKKSYKVFPENERKQPKKIHFDITSEIKQLKASLKSSLLNSILQCFLNARGLEFNQKQFGSKSLPFNSFNQLKQLKDVYTSADPSAVSTERINSILQNKKQYKDCYQFIYKAIQKLITDNKSYQKLNAQAHISKDKHTDMFATKVKIPLLVKKTLMQQMFEIEIDKVYNCTKCKLSFVQSINENFINLQSYKQDDIEKMLQKQFDKKPIADKCNSCHTIAKLTVSKVFKKVPLLLIFSLHYDLSPPSNPQPSQELSLLVNNNKLVYQFHSLVATSDNSHYYCIVQNSGTGEWYRFDDQQITCLGKKWQVVKGEMVVFANYQRREVRKEDCEMVKSK